MDVREKLVELLNGIIDGGFKWHSYSYESGEQLNNDEIASHLIANGVTVQDSKGVEIDPFNKWISVKDRLPDVGSIVLVSDNETDCHIWQYTNYSERGVAIPWTDEFGIPCKMEEITHWMPLPEPPKGE